MAGMVPQPPLMNYWPTAMTGYNQHPPMNSSSLHTDMVGSYISLNQLIFGLPFHYSAIAVYVSIRDI